MDDGEVRSRSPSPSLSPSPSPSQSPPRNSISAAAEAVAPSPATANSVTVAAAAIAELQNQPPLAAALPIQNPRRPSHSPAGREDCWSEGATAALVEAWSERFLELDRGSLKQTHWKEVADAVRSRTKKPHKSDAQCKNRIDTLKKKYRTEKTKVCSSPSYASPWPFFDRLDLLLGPIYKLSLPSSTPKAPAAAEAKLAQKPRTHVARKRKAPPLATAGHDDGGAKEEAAEKESSESLPTTGARRRRAEGMREVAMAVERLGEVYERVERLRMEMTEEVERLRASFAKEMELRRMEFFAKTQMEIAQFKKQRGGGNGGLGDEELRWNGGDGRRRHYHHQNNWSKNGNSHSLDDC